MGFRFRKSFKIAPGVKLNLGKKSAGISVGGKYGGISCNTKTGARARVSAPGTGLSYSTSLNTSKKTTSSSASTQVLELNAKTYMLLSIFLGYFGAHRFYRRQFLIGFCYLFTIGLFGIGWIVDAIISVNWFLQAKKEQENN